MLRSKQYAEAARLWAAGMSGKQIAVAVGATASDVYYTARWHREDFPRRRRQFVHVGQSEAERMRETIHAMRSHGASWRDVATATGRTIRTVRRWAHDPVVA